MCDWQNTGSTDWTQHSLLIDVSSGLSFGAYLIAVGKLCLDEVSLATADKDTPLTGLRPHPINLDFEE
ncbi:MAG: hypothetical protein IPM23_23735 [Candidatus Melainabacteria bacterium]|nr:hypothetical protein [Candidatus Melainabacteria bacterium]